MNPKMNNKKSKSGLIENYNSNILKKEIEVGIIGTFNCCKLFGTIMSQRGGGVIINISSDLGSMHLIKESTTIKKILKK